MRKICLFTSTRADWGLLRRVAEKLREAPDVDFHLLVTGSHLAEDYGNTAAEIEADGFELSAELPILESKSCEPQEICEIMGRAFGIYGRYLETEKPDILVVLGDRYETFCIAACAQVLGILVAHIHGGECTEGAIDEAFRHSITKMAYWHFPASDGFRQRILQLGEDPGRVFNVGALGVENILREWPIDRETLAKDLGFDLDHPYMLATFHPETLDAKSRIEPLEALLAAIKRFPNHLVIFTKANADAGGGIINERIERFVSENPEKYRCHASLGFKRYIAAVKWSDLVLGNSSSGILEVPVLGVPTVNVGDRQKGRLDLPSILNCAPETEAIELSIRQALDPSFRASLKDFRHPCDGGATSKLIVEKLTSTPLPDSIKKSFYDVSCQNASNSKYLNSYNDR